MSLDLNIYLPNTNENWKIRGNSIFYRKYADILLLNIDRDGQIWVSLDRRITKQVLILIKHLVNNNVDFFLTSRMIIHKKEIDTNDINFIISNYLKSLTDEVFFDGINNIGFDYLKNLSDFMTVYNCHSMLKEPFDKLKKSCGTYYDWYTKKTRRKIEREDMEDFIMSLEREIKLNILI
jgi:hypothetical protein